MSNIATALPNTILPIAPDAGGPASNLYPGKGNHGETVNLTSEQAQGYRSEERSAVDNQPNNDTDVSSQVNEGKSENFQEVLQRQLSEESDQKEGPSDDEKSESGKTEDTGDDKTSEQTEVVGQNLLDVRSRVLNTSLTGEVKGKAGATVANNEKTALTNNSDKEGALQQNIASVSGQPTGKSKPMAKQTSEQISGMVNEQSKKTEGAKTKDGKIPTLTVHEGKGAEAKGNNENKAAVVEANPGSGKEVVPNENQAAVVDPNPGNGKVIVSNENSAIKTNDQVSTQPISPLNVPENVTKTTSSQITETPKAVVIDEKMSLENVKPSAEQKLSSAEEIKLSQVTEKLNNIQSDSSGKKQNTADGNGKQTVLNNNKTTGQTIDTDDVDISYSRAQNDSIAVDSAVKTSSVLAESLIGSKNISSVTNVSNTTASNAADTAGNINNTGSIGAKSPSGQIIQNIQSNPVGPDRQINISLNPPELGRIRITFQQTNGEITGLLEVEKAQARYDVEKSLPQIVASLQESGVQVQRINVVLDDQGQPDQPKNRFAGDFEGTEKQDFSSGPGDNKSDGSKPGSSGSTLESEFQQARQNVVNEISDDAISAYA